MHRYVSVKFPTAGRSMLENNEVQILGQLRDTPLVDHPGRQHIVQLLDDFTVTGPNGQHICSVQETLGVSLSEQMEGGTLSEGEKWETGRQMILALAFLHANGITHGGEPVLDLALLPSPHSAYADRPSDQDIHPGNVLFTGKDLTGIPLDEIFAALSTEQYHEDFTDDEVAEFQRPYELPVSRRNGSDEPLGKEVPRYLVHAVTIPRPTDESILHAKVIDFSESSASHSVPSPGICHNCYTAPEMVMGEPWTMRADVWSLGSVVS